MGLPFAVKLANQYQWGFDTVQLPLTPMEFQQIMDAGYGMVLRDCASGTDQEWVNDVTNALNVGMTVALYQGYYAPMWSNPSEATSRANWAVARANLVSYPRYGTIWLDVEEIGTMSHQVIIDWINTWSGVIRNAGFGAGVYCGCQTLSGTEYYYDLPYTTHYWENCSQGCQQSLPVRGYEVLQSVCDFQIPGTNLIVDTDWFQIDQRNQWPEGMIKV